METFASLRVGGQRLYGMVHLPDTPRPAQGFPSVLILHGYTGNRAGDHRLLPLLSRHLTRLGIASARFDFRGSGDSEGDFSEMTVAREVEDTVAAFRYLQDLPEIDPERTMLLGFSMGGMVAALASAELRPHRLALWAPALPELWLGLLKGGFVPPVVSDQNGWPIGREFLLELPRLDPLAAVRRYGGVTRIFHGEADEAVPLSVGARYGEAAGAEVVVIPETNHTFDSLRAVEQLYDVTGRFLAGK